VVEVVDMDVDVGEDEVEVVGVVGVKEICCVYSVHKPAELTATSRA